MSSSVMLRAGIPGRFPILKQGKVRDIYDFGEHLLIIATDRISAFDVMPDGIPGKGKTLTLLSVFWFKWFEKKLPGLKTHFVAENWRVITKFYPKLNPFYKQLSGRSMLVKKVGEVLPVEAVVRGYLYGSAWKDYKKSGEVCGVKLPAGLKMADKLEHPIFTPATKTQAGHGENISFQAVEKIVGRELAAKIAATSIVVYKKAAEYAESQGIIIADTKFEFGVNREGELVLIDEVLTPDSSRFWSKDKWKPGREQPSFDKQYVREYLEELVREGKWDKSPPGPQLPPEIIEGTVKRYQKISYALVNFYLVTRQERKFEHI